MRKYIVASLILLTACSRSHGPRTASETLEQYYKAVQSSDTAKTYALSTAERSKYLKMDAASYFAMAYQTVDSIHILKERPTGDSIAEVLYTSVAYDRASGKKLDSGLVECTMIRENGEWKVSECHEPTQGRGPIPVNNKIPTLNLGFDIADNNNKPDGWYAGGGGRSMADTKDYSADLDPAIKHDGKYALHLKYVSGDGFGVATNYLGGLLPQVRGKRIRYTGWLKTKDVGGYAGLWWRVDGPNGEMLAFNNMQDSMIRGTNDWKKYSFDIYVDKSAANVNFGVLMDGHGEAWFDDLSIDTNGTLWRSPTQAEVVAAK